MQAVEHRIGPSVVGAAGLDDAFLAGVGARRADRGHDALGARAEHAEHFDRGHETLHEPGQLEFVFAEKTGDRAAGLEHLHDLVAHGRVVAAEHGGPARLQEVDIGIAVHISQVGALGFFHSDGEGIVEGEVVLHAAGDYRFRLVDEDLRAGAVDIEIAKVFRHFRAVHLPQGPAYEPLEPSVDVGGIGVFADAIVACFAHNRPSLASFARPAPRVNLFSSARSFAKAISLTSRGILSAFFPAQSVRR